jgi:hypothetical protein
MKKTIFAALMIATLIGLIGCQSLWYHFLNFFVDVSPDRFFIEEEHKKF